MNFVLPSSLLPHCSGRKFSWRRSSPFIKFIVLNLWFRGYATKAYAIKFHQSTTPTICIFPYRKKRLYILLRFFIVVDFYGGIGGIHLYLNKIIHKLTFLWRFYQPKRWWINGGIHQNWTYCATSTHKDVPKWDILSHFTPCKWDGTSYAIPMP